MISKAASDTSNLNSLIFVLNVFNNWSQLLNTLLHYLEFLLWCNRISGVSVEVPGGRFDPQARHSGLRIQHCRELWCRSQMLISGVAVAVAVV